MPGHQVGDAVDHVAHLLGRGHRLELALGQLQGQVEAAAVPGVDDGARAGGPGAAQQVGDQPDGALGGGQADALGPGGGRPLEPLERERQVGPRLSRATAWISSTITVSTVASIARLRAAVTSR